MKLIIMAVLVLIAFSSPCVAGSGELQRDSSNKGNIIQSPAWNGSKSTALTVYSTTVDYSGDLYYAVYSTSACQERWMPSASSTKASYVATTIPANTWTTPSVVNSTTPFGNFSGCTGYLKRQ